MDDGPLGSSSVGRQKRTPAPGRWPGAGFHLRTRAGAGPLPPYPSSGSRLTIHPSVADEPGGISPGRRRSGPVICEGCQDPGLASRNAASRSRAWWRTRMTSASPRGVGRKKIRYGYSRTILLRTPTPSSGRSRPSRGSFPTRWQVARIARTTRRAAARFCFSSA
jgi:hypothetical protein